MFDTIKVRLLRTFDRVERSDGYYQEGTFAKAMRWPSGTWDLLDSEAGWCFCTGAKEGDDFERV